MKMSGAVSTVETNVDKSKSINVGVKNNKVIFDILINKLYTNPLRTVVREYMTNARDSHREANIPDMPISIKLPVSFEPYLKITDYGMGISPDRMNDTFVYLGESTKSDSNLEHGGFGVGAKSGWAYTEFFNIETVCDGIKYLYFAYIDEGEPCLDLINKSECDENNTTTISIPIKHEDFKDVFYYVGEVMFFWGENTVNLDNVDPSECTSPVVDYYGDILYKNENMIILHKTDSRKAITRGSYIILDGILYDNIVELPSELNSNRNMYVYIFIFDVGELMPSISRDSLTDSTENKDTIIDRMNDAISLLDDDIDSAIDYTSYESFISSVSKCNLVNILTNRVIAYKNIELEIKYDDLYFPLCHHIGVKYFLSTDGDATFLINSNQRYKRLPIDVLLNSNFIYINNNSNKIDYVKIKKYMINNNLLDIIIIKRLDGVCDDIFENNFNLMGFVPASELSNITGKFEFVSSEFVVGYKPSIGYGGVVDRYDSFDLISGIGKIDKNTPILLVPFNEGKTSYIYKLWYKLNRYGYGNEVERMEIIRCTKSVNKKIRELYPDYSFYDVPEFINYVYDKLKSTFDYEGKFRFGTDELFTCLFDVNIRFNYIVDDYYKPFSYDSSKINSVILQEDIINNIFGVSDRFDFMAKEFYELFCIYPTNLYPELLRIHNLLIAVIQCYREYNNNTIPQDDLMYFYLTIKDRVVKLVQELKVSYPMLFILSHKFSEKSTDLLKNYIALCDK